MGMRLREYQTLAINAIETEHKTKRGTLLVLPTGTGKTIVFAKYIERFYRKTGKTSMILAHRGHLLKQAQQKLVQATGFKSSEIALERGASFAELDGLFSTKVVLASKDSLHPKRLARFPPDCIGLIIVDEAHRVMAKTFLNVLAHFPAAKVLGVTATPRRLDGKSLLSVLDSTAYVYELRDAIEQRYLVPIIYEIIDIHSVDLDKIKTVSGDYNEAQLESQLRGKEALHAVARPAMERMEGRQTIVFCSTIAHAEDLADTFNTYQTGCARCISSKDSEEDQDRILKEFTKGRFRFLCSVDMLTEGYDIPVCSGIIHASPTKSITKHNQRTGRGTRLLGKSGTYEESVINGKVDLYVIDFTGTAHGKALPVTLFDYIDGAKDVDVKQRAAMTARKRRVAPLKAMELAAKEIAAEEQAKVIAHVKYTSKKYEVGFAILGIHPRPGRWGGARVTAGQRSALLGMGFDDADVGGMDKGQASEVIAAIIQRREIGLCSYKQARILARHGLSPNIGFGSAHELVTLIAANEWCANDDIRELAETARQEAEAMLEIAPW